MRIDVLSRAKKKKFIEGLSDLGIRKIDQKLVRSGKEKIRAFSGELEKSEILDLWRVLPIEGIGLYVGKDMVNRNGVREVRLALDGMHVWKEQLEERVLELDEEQEKAWFLGEDVELTEEQGEIGAGFVSVKAGVDFVGVGKIGGSKTSEKAKGSGQKAAPRMLFGFLPKERRRKERSS